MAEPGVLVNGAAGDTLPQPQIACVTIDHPENVEGAGRSAVGLAVVLDQQFGGVEVALNAVAVVLKKEGVFFQEVPCVLLHMLNRTEDRSLERQDPIRIREAEIDNAIEIALIPQLIRGHANVLGGFLPREVVLAGDVAQTARVDGVEDPLPDGEQHVRRC